MGKPVVHFEIVGQDGQRLRRFYEDLFGWDIDNDNPLDYGVVAREGNTTPTGWASEVVSARPSRDPMVM